jgi:transcriptional regulator GlxA family with amidase domain
MTSGREHHVVLAVFPGFQALDLSGPLEVFHTAGYGLPPGRRYRTSIVAPTCEPMRSESGLNITPDAMFDDVDDPDTLMVIGGLGPRLATDDPEAVAAVDGLAARSGRVASVCTGSFLLAATGRLDGRRASTHWAFCAEMAERFPAVDVDADAIYVRDGVWTSAGVTAGIDLALAIVAEDHGPELAHGIAAMLVMFVQRAGGQSQFSPHLSAASPSDPRLRALLSWVAEHPDEDLSVSALARQAAMSERTFARAFVEQTGRTPAAYVESVRVDVARRLLETTDLTVAAIARQAGFGSDVTLHRAFRRGVGTTPDQYRRHFASTRPHPRFGRAS